MSTSKKISKSVLRDKVEYGWTFASETVDDIKKKIQLSGYTYGAIDKLETHIGVKTGMNELFHITEEKKKELDENPKYSWIFRRVYRGRDLENYGGFRTDGLWCITMYDNKVTEGELKENMPKLYSYLYEQKDKIEDGSKTCQWFEVVARDYHVDSRDRIVYGELGDYMKFARLQDNSICADTCYQIYGEKEWLDRVEKVFRSPFANNVYRLMFAKNNMHGSSRHNPDGISEWVIPINIQNTGDVDRDIIEAYGLTDDEVGILQTAFGELSSSNKKDIEYNVNKNVAEKIHQYREELVEENKYSAKEIDKAIEMELVSRMAEEKPKIQNGIMMELYGGAVNLKNELNKIIHLGIAYCSSNNWYTLDEKDNKRINPLILSYLHELSITESGDAEGNGAVYTPPSVVEEMVRNSIGTYLKRNIHNDKADASINALVEEPILAGYFCDRDEVEYIEQLVHNIRVCDMCIGCGAFPVEVARQLVELRECIEEELGKKSDKYTTARDVLKRSIVGCDIDTEAVRVTKLRLQLLLARCAETQYEVVDIDCNFISGNSMIRRFNSAKYGAQTIFSLGNEANSNWASKLNFDRLSDKLRVYASVKEMTKQSLSRNVLTNTIDSRMACVEEYFKVVPPCILWNGNEVEMDEDETEELIDEIRYKTEKKTLGNVAWELEFPKDALAGGFDIIIGNPPYIPINRAKDYKIMEFYSDMCDRGADLCLYFYCLAVNLVKDKTGVVNMITSNKWLTAKYGMQFRKTMSSIYDVTRIVSYGGKKLFENADVDVVEMELVKDTNSNHELFEYVDKSDY